MKHARADYDHIQDPSGKIPEDEPVFLLRGQDVLAPALLDRYASKLSAVSADREFVVGVSEQADAMRAWQDAHGSKVADRPAMLAEDDGPETGTEGPETETDPLKSGTEGAETETEGAKSDTAPLVSGTPEAVVGDEKPPATAAPDARGPDDPPATDPTK